MAQLRQIRPATADGSGNITFTFPPVNVNSAWVGTLSVPTAPVTADFLVMVADQGHGGWSAASPFGMITANGSEQIVVTGTGMTPGVQYNCVLLGQIIPGGTTQTSPQPVTSKVLVAGIPGASPVAVTIDQTVPLEETPYRSDGRAYPLGSQVTNVDFTQASGTIVIPATPGGHILVHSIIAPVQYSTSGAWGGSLQGTVSNNLVRLCQGAAGAALTLSPISDYVPPGGLLLDVNTPVLMQTPGGVANAGQTGAILYDVVS